jgi:threonine dehydratase
MARTVSSPEQRDRTAAARPLEVGRWPIPTLQDVYRARRVVDRYLPRTPLIRPAALAERLGCDVYVKLENLQPIGAFKVRGGLNLVSRLSAEERARGVVTASTGNHGQSIAYAAREFGVRAIIYMPEVCNALKVASMRRLGAEIVFHGRDFDEAREAAVAHAARDGGVYVHAANEPDLIAGVATSSLEIMEEVPDLDVLIVPVGGGSGLCGACLVGKAVNPHLTVWGVQSVGAPAFYESWKRRELLTLDQVDTFAEGVATRVAFELPAQILWEVVDDVVLVTDGELRQAILTMLETTRQLAEGAGAAPLAAAYARRAELDGKKVGLVLSGGNLTLDQLAHAMSEEVPW